MKAVELLAPAGSMEAFKGAINAGADAVYLGSTKYGARAYAENFDESRVILALRLAHLYKKKVYLTVNTLMTNPEISGLKDFIHPFYEEGLDGVIVQDLGVMSFLRTTFPALKIHASTQLSISTKEGASYLKELGLTRVVPSRELNLSQVKDICNTGIEVEAFIHGAMCYSYSGRCLMSSIIGGRSGNRGRCAQPCRLEYGGCFNIKNPLSLKDMCTLDIIPSLIEAGICSFKIEGRMKKPEYAAGVTAIYRQAIDDYMSLGRIKDTGSYIKDLKKLYIRTDTGSGYYEQETGKAMLTQNGPGYEGGDDEYHKLVRERYVREPSKLPVSLEGSFKIGEPAKLSLTYNDVTVSLQGDIPQIAQNKPVTREMIVKSLSGFGETSFELTSLVVNSDDNIFIPVGALKSLRREAVALLEKELTKPAFKDSQMAFPESLPFHETYKNTCIIDHLNKRARVFSVYVDDIKQFEILIGHKIIDKTGRIYVPGEVLSLISDDQRKFLKSRDIKLIYSLPQVLKNFSIPVNISGVDGVFVHDMDGAAFALKESSHIKDFSIIGDSSFYVWNDLSRDFLEKRGILPSVPLELSKDQLSELGIKDMEYVVYGRIPLMVTANCVAKSSGSCLKNKGTGKTGDYFELTDRKGEPLFVKLYCSQCYNVIYSAKPLSLHRYSRSVLKGQPSSLRLMFTNESQDDLKAVLDYYTMTFWNNNGVISEAGSLAGDFPVPFTFGSYKRSVE